MKQSPLNSLFAGMLLTGSAATVMAAPGSPVIAWMPLEYQQGTPINVKWDMWWGENGTSWKLYANSAQVCSGTLVANPSKAAQKGACTLTPDAGSYDLKVVLSNSDGDSASAIKTITVTGGSEPEPDPAPNPTPDPEPDPTPDPAPEPEPDVAPPAKPVISWMDASQKAGDIEIKWDMWWGTNGTSWTLESNGEQVCNGLLTANGNNAQNGRCTVNFSTGDYQLQVFLTNPGGSTGSDGKTISVSGGSDDSSGGGSGNDGAAGNIGSGATPLPTDYSASGLRNHQPYENSSDSVVGAYFVEWGIYGRDYQPAQIPASNLTHLLYGFIPVCGPNESLKVANPNGHSILQQSCEGKQDFEVTIHDRYAALEKNYTGDQYDQDYRGIFNQLRRIKLANPDLVILPSVGGWTLSDPFYYLDDSNNRKVFVDSVVDFLKTYTFFDGVDLDWEYPGGGGANGALGKSTDDETYTALMKELRSAFDTLSEETGRTYQITSAVGAAPSKIDQVNYREASQYMDYVFAMTYDYYGAWDGRLGHHAGLYPGSNALNEGFSGDESVENLIAAGVPANKLVLGVAMYGRGWSGVTGVTGNDPFTGKGGAPISLAANNGHWEAGVVDYFRVINEMLGGDAEGSGVNGWSAGYDQTAQAPYVWKASTGELITYENGRSAKNKAEYVRQNGLAGTFSWEIDGDNGDILNAVHEGLGHAPK